MTEIYRAEDRTDSLESHSTGRYSPINRNQPYLTPLDLMMGAVICLMIWGPLAAGAFASN